MDAYVMRLVKCSLYRRAQTVIIVSKRESISVPSVRWKTAVVNFDEILNLDFRN